MGKEELCPTWWRISSCFCSKMRNQLSKSKARCFFFLNNYYSVCRNKLYIATLYQFWHYFVPMTNSPVSLLVNLFFFSLFSLLGWGIFISSMGFLFLNRTVFLPLCVCALVSFWRLCFANKPNQNYLYINKARSCLKVVIIGKGPNLVPSRCQSFP